MNSGLLYLVNMDTPITSYIHARPTLHITSYISCHITSQYVQSILSSTSIHDTPSHPSRHINHQVTAQDNTSYSAQHVQRILSSTSIHHTPSYPSCHVTSRHVNHQVTARTADLVLHFALLAEDGQADDEFLEVDGPAAVPVEQGKHPAPAHTHTHTSCTQ